MSLISTSREWDRGARATGDLRAGGARRSRWRATRGSLGAGHRVERLEERALLAVNLISSYTGLSENGFVPPDTCGAAGPTSYVESQNQDLAIFTPKATGTSSVTSSFTTFWFTQGGLARASASSGLSDPIVVWDDQVNRFIVGDQDVDDTNHKDTYDIAVSKSASPATLTTADWVFYQVNTTETNRNADYPGNFGYNRDAFVFTLNQNQAVSGAGSAVQVSSLNINDLVAGNPLVTSGAGQNVFVNDIPTSVFPAFTNGGQHTTRPTVMHDSVAGGPMWLLESTIGGGSSINVIRMTNVLSTSPTYAKTSVSVNSYSSVVQPLQPDGTGLAPSSGNGALWTHILKSAEYNNTIVASDQISVSSTEDDSRWYEINVSGATPTLVDQGNVSSGNNTYDVFPSIDINARGDIGMTYTQSGTGTNQFMSTYITGRTTGDSAGTMETPVLVKAGVTNNTDGREGDLTGINTDSTPLTVTPPLAQSATEGSPATINLGSFADSEGNFWAGNEWAAAGGLYSTTIGQFMLGSKGPWSIDVDWGDGTTHGASSVSSVGSLGSLSHTYGEEGTKTVTVKVTDTSDGRSDTKSFQVGVSDPKVVAAGVPVFATACSPLSGVLLATFKDPGGAEPNPSDPTDGIPSHYHVVSIDWGDSTPLDTTSGSIGYSGSPGSKTDPFTVTGSHTFETEGTFTITVVIDHEGETTTVTTTAIVKDKLGLLLLDPTGSQSLMVTGNGSVTVNGDCGAVVVDSNAPDAAFVTGNGVVTAGDFDVTGGVVTHGHGFVPSPVDHEAPTADPLGLGLPSPLPPAPVGNTATVLNPGTYVGGLHFSGKSAVTLTPGVYVMEGGGFAVDGQASVLGSGVVIINIPGGPSDTISVSGKGVVSLSAPTGGPYQGVAVVQVSANPVGFAGKANVTIAGVFYTPNAPVSITGNAVVTINPGSGTATLPPIFGAMVAFDLQASGNGDLIINPDDPPPGPAAPAGGSAVIQDAAIEALTTWGGSSAPTYQATMDVMVLSLPGADDLLGATIGGTKKKTS
jgi:hypothetical protein